MFLDNPQRPADELLHWYFNQVVLVNMRGAGESNLEHDFPLGFETVGNILSGPKSVERMEFELIRRLDAQAEIGHSEVAQQ